MQTRNIVIGTVVVALLAGCSMPKFRLPRVHKITVQQGNVITQEMIDKLRPGMNRAQVAFVMGEPVMRNTFNNDRWDYIYTVEVPGLYEELKRMSIYFVDDRLNHFTGDYVPTEQARAAMKAQAESSPDDDSTPSEEEDEGAADPATSES
jgi:outer membrane protein assembly factor BamE